MAQRPLPFEPMASQCRAMKDNRRAALCFPFAGDSLGGSHISVLGLLKQLDPSRFRIIVVPEVWEGRIASHFEGFEQVRDPVTPRRLFVPGEAFGPVKFARTFSGIWPRVRLLRQMGADIVHTNDGRTHAGWALAARIAGARLVWHHRGDPDALGLRLAAPLLADKVLTVSSFSFPRGKWWSAAGKAEVLHSPFDTNLIVDRQEARCALAREANILDDTVVLGFFGSFISRKRPLLFVDSVVRLQEMLDRPVAGLMFGEAEDPEMDQALRRHIDARGARDCIKLMGYRKPGHFWIAACDQLVVPAVGEPFGRTLVEAMLVGTPVVATRSGGNVEALAGGMGILTSPEDATALAAGCARLARNPLIATEMAERAKADARDRFGEARHGARVSEIYAELLRAGRSMRRLRAN